MTPEEQLDEARGKEVLREFDEAGVYFTFLEVATLAARRAREGWTPPEPVVNPDLLAFREWLANDHEADGWTGGATLCRLGRHDDTEVARAYLAGARMAREQERERAKELVRGLEDIVDTDQDEISHMARAVLAKYRGEA